jgi:hypothetical protein
VLLGSFVVGSRSDGTSDAYLGLATARADLADQHYKRALAFYENKDYPRAIREFQAAYKVRQLPRILLNIGQVYRKLGMASTALKFYEHYLRVDLQAKPEIKIEVDRYIAQTRAMLDPPDIVPLPSKSAAAAAAEAVADAPYDVIPITVPELYTGDDDQPSGPAGKGSKSGAGNLKARGKGTSATADVAPPLAGTSPTARSWQSPNSLAPPSTNPATIRSSLVTPPPPPAEKPLYKKGWFWGVVGGVAAGVVITGVAAGVAAQKSSLPTTILYPMK